MHRPEGMKNPYIKKHLDRDDDSWFRAFEAGADAYEEGLKKDTQDVGEEETKEVAAPQDAGGDEGMIRPIGDSSAQQSSVGLKGRGQSPVGKRRGVMTKQEEIEDIICNVIRRWDQSSISADWQPLYGGITMSRDIVLGLHSQGLVIQVVPDDSPQIFRAVEPLIAGVE